MNGNTPNWEQRGQRAVGAAADLATGLFKGFRSLGGRIQAARFQNVVEAFCAYSGLLAAQNGRLKQAEIASFRNFLVENRQHPVLGHFTPDELVDKFRHYAIKAFLEEHETFTSVLDNINKQSEEASLVVAGCLTVTFADGHCDQAEREQLDRLAINLQVDLLQLSQSMGVVLPPTGMAYHSPTAAPQPTIQSHPLPQPVPVVPARQQPAFPAPTQQQPAPQAPTGGGSSFARAVGGTTPPPAQPWSTQTQQPAPPTPAATAAPAQKAACTFCQGKGCTFCNNTGFK